MRSGPPDARSTAWAPHPLRPPSIRRFFPIRFFISRCGPQIETAPVFPSSRSLWRATIPAFGLLDYQNHGAHQAKTPL